MWVFFAGPKGDLWLDHFGLGVLFIGMRLAAYLALVLRTRSKD